MGRMKNGANLMKYMLIVFNLVFMVFSLLLAGLGVAVSFKGPMLIKLLPIGVQVIGSIPPWVPWKMFFVGLIFFLICVLGCYGASNETYCALVMSAIILFVVIILQVILGVLVYIIFVKVVQVQEILDGSWPDVSISPQNATEEVYSEFYDNLRTSPSKDVLKAQEKFNCCGVFGKSDYSVKGKTLSVLVKSCCPAEIEKCMPDKAYDDGCLPEMNAVYKSWLEWKPIILGVAIGLVCLQVMLAASALYLAKATRQI